MFYSLIKKKRDRWYNSSECTVKELIEYMTNANKLRDVQIDAIKTYLFLKIKCNNKSNSKCNKGRSIKGNNRPAIKSQ